MNNYNLSGSWTYRSFTNVPEYVEDFNKIALAEAELTLEAYVDPGTIRGQMAFRSNPPSDKDARLSIVGSVNESNPTAVHLRGVGVAGTEAEGWIYEQIGYLVPQWPSGVDQRPALVGMVTRVVSHPGGNGSVRPAGFVGSFVAVKRDVPEPRDVIPLPGMVVGMLADKTHRLHHATWHAVRNTWPFLSPSQKQLIIKLGWQPGPKGGKEEEMRPAAVRRVPFVSNDSGEDFLFMHREMINMVREHAHHAGATVESWLMIPPPGPVSAEPDYAKKPPVLPAPGNPDGFAVMPPWSEPGYEDDARRQAALKSDEYYWSHMFPASQQFQDVGYLATLTLGALGGLLEWTIHNDMHMRWTSAPRDPKTGTVVLDGRNALDFDDKWSLPIYDSLSEPYSSLVNPVFWRLHGWIDDRINDWFNAHEAVHKGQVKRRTYRNAEWFEKGAWVKLDEPWSAPLKSDGSYDLDIATMELVNRTIFAPPAEKVATMSIMEAKVLRAKPRVQWVANATMAPIF